MILSMIFLPLMINSYSVYHTTEKEAGGYTMPSLSYAQQFVHPEDFSKIGEEIQKAIKQMMHLTAVSLSIVYFIKTEKPDIYL